MVKVEYTLALGWELESMSVEGARNRIRNPNSPGTRISYHVLVLDPSTPPPPTSWVSTASSLHATAAVERILFVSPNESLWLSSSDYTTIFERYCGLHNMLRSGLRLYWFLKGRRKMSWSWFRSQSSRLQAAVTKTQRTCIFGSLFCSCAQATATWRPQRRDRNAHAPNMPGIICQEIAKTDCNLLTSFSCMIMM